MSYDYLYKSGELAKRVERLWQRLAACDICPRQCGVNRLIGRTGFCHSGHLPIVSSFCDHHGEEPVLSGSRGSGTIFFGNCNLKCCYCQNHQISQNYRYQKNNMIDHDALAGYMLYLQNSLGCHNINFVSPSHFVPQIAKALLEAIPMGLKIPLVYNTNSFDSTETLKELAGIIDIYLPDLKYASDRYAQRFSKAHRYVIHSRNAIKEMYRQVGELVVDNHGVAQRGLILRHLVLPNNIAGSRQSFKWLAEEVSPHVTISLMSQYHPVHKAYNHLPLARPINNAEYTEALQAMEEAGLGEGWAQDLVSHKHYIPDFERKSHPFEFI
ncbi:MAG: radical SAM protein [Dehalococcoidia bacterium]|nr:MAG: radical SAM protein [Dehalococcoidia bacterium]